MVATKTLVSADEFLLMPKGVNKQELIDGEVVEMSPVGGPHAKLQVRLVLRVGPHLERTRQGEVFVELGFRLSVDPDTVRAPDVAFISAEQLRERPLGQGFYGGYPDLAVEVISPGDTPKEIEDKVQAYFRAGTRLIWLAYPERRTVRVRYPDGRTHVLHSNDVLSGEDVLPGLEVRLSDLFGE